MNPYAIRSALLGTVGVALALASGFALAATYRLSEVNPVARLVVFSAPPSTT